MDEASDEQVEREKGILVEHRQARSERCGILDRESHTLSIL